MATTIDIRVPDIGEYDSVEIIEVLVQAGDTVSAEQSLITLESDKASMEIPSPHDGTITDLLVKVGDKLSEGDVFARVTTAADAPAEASSPIAAPTAPEAPSAGETPVASNQATTSTSENLKVVVPEIGDFEEIEVIEVLVNVGDTVELDQSLITLESDKASMEIPSTVAGTVTSVAVAVGDKLSQGSLVAEITGTATSTDAQATQNEPQTQISTAAQSAPAKAPAPIAPANKPQSKSSPTQKIADESYRRAHASPSVRKFARELGVDLSLITGSGRKNRILKDDVQQFVKSTMSAAGSSYGGAGAAGAGIPSIPEVDFSKFGEVERVEMTRINVLTAENLHRAWLNLPMVTHHDDADITELEAFRQSIKKEAADQGIRVTGLVFHIKALTAALKKFPRFNSSLSADGQSLFYKKYFNIGIAVDTPNGLVVPVLKDTDKKSIYQLSEEMTDLSTRAREKKLKPTEMQGASMTISSLGGIGGNGFTPIVNPPEVAILGITRAKMQPVWDGNEFKPRLMCPLDLTYDHRVIDGADGARFMTHYCKVISDIRKIMLY